LLHPSLDILSISNINNNHWLKISNFAKKGG